MPEVDLTLLQPVLQLYGVQGRTALLPALHAAQAIYGCLPEPVAAAVAQSLQVPLADVHGVIDFYSLFHPEPLGHTLAHVCGDLVCAMAGSDGVMNLLARNPATSALTADGVPQLRVERASCLGLCEHAPALLVQGAPASLARNSSIESILAGNSPRPYSVLGGALRLLTANCGKGRPTTLVEYEAGGGYQALRKVLQLSPAQVISEVKSAGLVGRGGAAFSTGTKWEGAAAAPGAPKYVICNADEAEPGTFKDRVMMEDDPHRILEGLIIAAYAIGASKGYWYIRGEYSYPLAVVTHAVEQARQAGYLGQNLLGTHFSFDLELRRGAGAYVCGEETALFESIEGKRGFPRIKPPFPTTAGLFGKPTVINNVETLCNVPLIFQLGAGGYRQMGTPKSPGSKLFCISGDVARPGLYEVPFGYPFRTILYEDAGGMRQNNTFQAALFGGAAGAFAVEKDLDVHLSFEDLRAAGLPLGSGVIIVFDHTRDLRQTLARLGHFFAEESCGKCFPCQIGTQRQSEILKRIAAGDALPGDAERLADVGWTMTDASLCGLGQTAASAVLSAIKLFPAMFEPEVQPSRGGSNG